MAQLLDWIIIASLGVLWRLCSLKDKTRNHEEFQSFHAKKTKNVFCIVFPTLQNKYRITFAVAVFEKPKELACTANIVGSDYF